ncbi:MAG: pantoate--beta-alanine ligase [Candidatus Marinimicrobia bacterium]|nr:pantoate--beta-alanine ligase [Candidatus Neomarinimicrobiota bacterium]
MRVLHTVEDLRSFRRAARGSVGLVPTMGGLHEGHLSLVRLAQAHSDVVVVSIYVNPTQFPAATDFQTYPRTWEADRQALEALSIDAVFLPTDEVMYPEGVAAPVHVKGLTARWEGAHRPGHFDGVCTVVAKLFSVIRPDIASFGEKDYQQLLVVRRLVAELDLPIKIVAGETVRAADGLALSSRNARLTRDERSRAPRLKQALDAAAQAITSGEGVTLALQAQVDRLTTAGFKVDYLALVDGQTLEPIDAPQPGARLLAAAHLGAVRLIDNRPL